MARLLRESAKTSDLKLAAVTCYGQKSGRQKAQDAGFGFHLVKPVDVKKSMSILSACAKPGSSLEQSTHQGRYV